jgi:hypothetical protein
MLSTRGRRIRMLAITAVIAMLVAGTLWGQDDHFPFGPFRMYSVRNKFDGRIKGTLMEVVDAGGRVSTVEIRADEFGLRRAEVEGQIERFERDPGLLRHVARAYERLHPGEQIVALRLYYEITRLSSGRPMGMPTRTLVAEWQRA